MVTLESNFQTAEELKEALTSHGLHVEPDTPPSDGSTAAKVRAGKVAPVSEQPGEPGGEKPAAEPDGKSGVETEPAQPKPQEAAPAVEPAPAATPTGEETELQRKARGGWQRKLERATERVRSLEEQNEDLGGTNKRLREELEEAKAKLAEVKGAEPPKETGPVRPKRPTRAELELQEDGGEKLMETYEEQLDAYNAAERDKAIQTALTTEREARAEEAKNAAVIAEENAFVERRDRDKANIPDFDQVIASLPSSYTGIPSETVQGYIKYRSKYPAALIHFLAKDYLDTLEKDPDATSGAEADRISSLDVLDQLFEIREIEKRIVSERGGTKPANGAAPPAEPPKPADAPKAAEPKPPAKPEPPKAPKTPEPPIEPIGGRGTAATPGNIEAQMQAAADAGDSKTFLRLRRQQAMDAARAAGRV